MAARRVNWFLVWFGLFVSFCPIMSFAHEIVHQSPGSLPGWAYAAVMALFYTYLMWAARHNGVPSRPKSDMTPEARRQRFTVVLVALANVILDTGLVSRHFGGGPALLWLAFYALAIPAALPVGNRILEASGFSTNAPDSTSA